MCIESDSCSVHLFKKIENVNELCFSISMKWYTKQRIFSDDIENYSFAETALIYWFYDIFTRIFCTFGTLFQHVGWVLQCLTYDFYILAAFLKIIHADFILYIIWIMVWVGILKLYLYIEFEYFLYFALFFSVPRLYFVYILGMLSFALVWLAYFRWFLSLFIIKLYIVTNFRLVIEIHLTVP